MYNKTVINLTVTNLQQIGQEDQTYLMSLCESIFRPEVLPNISLVEGDHSGGIRMPALLCSLCSHSKPLYHTRGKPHISLKCLLQNLLPQVGPMWFDFKVSLLRHTCMALCRWQGVAHTTPIRMHVRSMYIPRYGVWAFFIIILGSLSCGLPCE